MFLAFYRLPAQCLQCPSPSSRGTPMPSATLTLKQISERLTTLRFYYQKVRQFTYLKLSDIKMANFDKNWIFPHSNWTMLGFLRPLLHIFTWILLVWSHKPHMELFHRHRFCILFSYFLFDPKYVLSGGDVYNIYATISLNPKTNTLFDLRWEYKYYTIILDVISYHKRSY